MKRGNLIPLFFVERWKKYAKLQGADPLQLFKN
jgi:hypothetical protein